MRDPSIEALLRIYELTAFLYIAILAAILPIYALIISYLNRLVGRITEDYQKTKAEAETKAILTLEEIETKFRGSGDREPLDWTARRALVESQLAVLQGLSKLEAKNKERQEHYSFNNIFIKPSAWILGGLVLIGLAIITIEAFVFHPLLSSVVLFIFSWIAVLSGLWKYPKQRLKEISKLAQEQQETPMDIVQRILREQTEATNKIMITKLEAVIEGLNRLFKLKEPLFELSIVDEKGFKEEELQIKLKKGIASTVKIGLRNISDFPIKDPDMGALAPKEFSTFFIEHKTATTRDRLVGMSVFPGGLESRIILKTINCWCSQILEFTMKVDEPGNYSILYIVHSSSHEYFSKKIPVIVE